MLAFLEQTPPVQEAKRRASLKFSVHLDMSQIGIVCFRNNVCGIFKIPNT